MKNKLTYLFLALMISSGISCKKYLSEKSDKQLVIPSSIEDLQDLLDDSNRMNVSVTPSLNESYADDYFLSDATYNALIDQQQQVYKWQPILINYSNDWSANYAPIYNTNLCLEGIEKNVRTTLNAQKWDNVKGSAYFFRAYYYLMLTLQYAKAFDETSADKDLGIVLRHSSDFNEKSVRSSVRQSYQQITNDIENAIPLLPDYPLIITRPSKNAAYALLSRMYLSMRKYDSAFKYADMNLYMKSNLLDYNTVALNAAAPFPKLDNPETIFYTTENGSLGLQKKGLIDSNLYASYAANDLRRTGFFKANGTYQNFKGNYSKDVNAYFTGLARDEIYLIRAECNARKGMITEAMSDLNTLLNKRWKNTVAYVPVTATGISDAVSKVLFERRKELLLRTLRLSDIKRLNKEGFNIIPIHKINGTLVSLPPNDNRYALPIPNDIITFTGIQQN